MTENQRTNSAGTPAYKNETSQGRRPPVPSGTTWFRWLAVAVAALLFMPLAAASPTSGSVARPSQATLDAWYGILDFSVAHGFVSAETAEAARALPDPNAGLTGDEREAIVERIQEETANAPATTATDTLRFTDMNVRMIGLARGESVGASGELPCATCHPRYVECIHDCDLKWGICSFIAIVTADPALLLFCAALYWFCVHQCEEAYEYCLQHCKDDTIAITIDRRILSKVGVPA